MHTYTATHTYMHTYTATHTYMYTRISTLAKWLPIFCSFSTSIHAYIHTYLSITYAEHFLIS